MNPSIQARQGSRRRRSAAGPRAASSARPPHAATAKLSASVSNGGSPRVAVVRYASADHSRMATPPISVAAFAEPPTAAPSRLPGALDATGARRWRSLAA